MSLEKERDAIVRRIKSQKGLVLQGEIAIEAGVKAGLKNDSVLLKSVRERTERQRENLKASEAALAELDKILGIGAQVDLVEASKTPPKK